MEAVWLFTKRASGAPVDCHPAVERGFGGQPEAALCRATQELVGASAALTITGHADQGVEIIHRSQEVEECIYTTTGRELRVQDKLKLHNQKITKPVIAPTNAKTQPT